MAESKKILFLSNHFITLYSFRKELIKRLCERGHEVYISSPEDEQFSYFEEMGCRAAYNLDGGGSAVMCFNGDYVNRQSNGGDREISDYLLIAEVEKEG